MNVNDENLRRVLASFSDEYTFEGFELTAPESHGVCGDTPLHSAAFGNNVDMLKKLMPYVTNIDVAGDLGLTPMGSAALHGSVEAVEYLLACGANPFVRDEDGATVVELMRIRPGFESLIERIVSGSGDA